MCTTPGVYFYHSLTFKVFFHSRIKRPVKITMDKALRLLAKLLQPHLSKMIGSKRPPPIDWRLDPVPAPKPKEHVSSYGNSIGNSAISQGTIDMRRSYRILCLDGGGVRGALTTGFQYIYNLYYKYKLPTSLYIYIHIYIFTFIYFHH